MTVSTLVVEDEPLARGNLSGLISQVAWLRLLAEASDGTMALELIDQLRPDLVFMDIRLPELSGLEVLANARHKPAVVFTTAYGRYAVAAFEQEAVDYLVKPFSAERFHNTLERVRRRMNAPTLDDPARDRPLARLFARKADSIIPIAVEDISRIEARGDYAQAHAGERVFLVHATLKSLAAGLDPNRFVCVHRSRIVNLDHVASIEPFDDRRLAIRLSDGSTVVASRTGSRRLRRFMR